MRNQFLHHCVFFAFLRWTGSRYSRTAPDAVQDVTATSTSYVNGILNVQFTRPRNTGNDQDLQFSDSGSDCYYFFFPIGGGNVNNKEISRHSRTPVVSSQKICVTTNPQVCSGGPPTPVPPPPISMNTV